MDLSVILPTHNPHPDRLRKTLQAIAAQESLGSLEVVLIDNASTPRLEVEHLKVPLPGGLRIVRELELGLSHARARGFSEAQGRVLVLVDDDNVLAPGYLSTASTFLNENPNIGAVGGKVVPEYELQPSAAMLEFTSLLALRDLGESVLVASGFQPGQPRSYPLFAPLGAGMALTREAARIWLERFKASTARLPDRRGRDLSSSGDNDIILSMLASGLGVAYLPSLVLTHLIPAQRVEPAYLERLNFGIQKSWMQVLALHHASPWPPLSPLGARLRQARAWFKMQPWRSAAHRIRFAGACGHFSGRVGRP